MKIGKTFWNGSIFFVLILASALMTAPDVAAQRSASGSASSNTNISRDLWNLWRQGFEQFEKGEMKMISGKYSEAIPLYEESLTAFKRVREQNPEWNKSVIEYRITLSVRRIDSAKRKAGEEADVAKRAEQRKKYEDELKAIQTKDSKVKELGQANETLKKQLQELQSELKNVRYDAQRGNAAINQIKSLLTERDVLEKKLAVLNLQYTELLEKHKKAALSPEMEKLLNNEQTKNAAFMKIVKEQNDELAKIKQQFNTLTEEKQKRDTMLENVNKTLSSEKTFAEIERKKNLDEIAKLKKALDASNTALKAKNKELNEKIHAVEESAELVRKLKAEQTVAASARRIEAEAATVKKDNEALQKAVAKIVAEKTDLTEKLKQAMEESAKRKNDLILNIEQRNSFAKLNDSMEKQLKALEKREKELSQAYENSKQELAKVKSERDLFAAKINEKFNDMADKRIMELKAQVITLNSSLEKQKADRAKLEDSGKKLAVDAEQLKKTMDAVKAESAKNSTALLKAEESIQSLTAKLAASEKTAQTAKTSADALTKELHTTKAALADASKQKNTLAASETALKNQLKKLNADLAKLTETGKVMELKLAESGKTSMELAAAKVNLDAQIKKLKEDFAAQSESGKTLVKQMDELKQIQGKLAAAETNLKNSIVGRETAEANLAKQNEAVKLLTAKLAAAEANLKNTLTGKATAEANLAKQNETVKLLTAKLTAAEANLKNSIAGTAAAEANLAKQNEAVKTLTEKLVAAEANFKKTLTGNQKLDEIGKQLAAAQNALKEQTAIKIKLEQELKHLKTAATASRTAVEQTAKQPEAARLEIAVKALTAKLADSEKTLKEKDAAKSALEAEIKNLNGRLTAEIQKQQTGAVEVEKAKKALEAEIASLKNQLAKATIPKVISGDAAKNELSKVTASLIELREANTQYQNAVKNLTAAKNKLETENQTLTASMAKLKKQLETADTAPNNSSVAKENLDLKEKAARDEKLYAQLKKERDELAVRRTELDKEIVALRLEKNTLKKSESLLKADLKRLSDGGSSATVNTLTQKNQAIDDLIKEIESLKATHKDFENRVSGSRNEMMRQKMIADKAVETAKKAVADAKRYRTELIALRSDVEDGVLPVKAAVKPASKPTTAAVAPTAKPSVPAATASAFDQKAYQEAMDNGRKAEDKNELGTALWQYWRAADIGQNKPEPYLALVRVHLKRNEKESAEKAYRKALQFGASRDTAQEEKFK